MKDKTRPDPTPAPEVGASVPHRGPVPARKRDELRHTGSADWRNPVFGAASPTVERHGDVGAQHRRRAAQTTIRRVRESLDRSPLDTSDIEVRLLGGDLILRGSTASEEELGAIVERCAHIDGVEKVIVRASSRPR